MVRRTLVAMAATAALLAGLTGQAMGHPPGPGQHLHCLSTPNGETHSIARGVTLMAPHEPAFHNLHDNVHLGAFVGHKLTLSPDTTAPFTCPPSP